MSPFFNWEENSMTISVTNTTSSACEICHEDYIGIEKKDTSKVVELACNHFYHLKCLSPWLVLNETANQDLSCCYQCPRSLLPKMFPLQTFDAESVENRLREIEQSEDFSIQSEVNVIINCVAQLKPHSNCIATLIRNIVETQESEESYEEMKNWVKKNMKEDYLYMAFLILGELYDGGNSLRFLDQEIRNLAAIPITEWSTEINEKGISVNYGKDTEKCRMRLSKDYLQRATHAYLCEKIHNPEEFEKNLAEQEKLHDHDQEVVDAISDARSLHKAISDTIKAHAPLPLEQIIVAINELMKTTQLSESSQRTIPLIISEILLQRGALRTFNEEIDRWKKEPMERWPRKIKEEGVRYLDEKNAVKHINGEYFMSWVKAHQKADKTMAVTSEIFSNPYTFIITQFIGLFT